MCVDYEENDKKEDAIMCVASSQYKSKISSATSRVEDLLPEDFFLLLGLENIPDHHNGNQGYSCY